MIITYQPARTDTATQTTNERETLYIAGGGSFLKFLKDGKDI
jgi:hypothetical protein